MNNLSTETADQDHIDSVETLRHTVKIFLSGFDCVVILGSKQKMLTIQVLLEEQSKDPALMSFCAHVSAVIQALSLQPTDTVAVNESHQVHFFYFIDVMFHHHHSHLTNYIQITEYLFIKVEYESMVDWNIKMDYLCCNPEFSGRPQYDFVIVNHLRGYVFAQLVFVFVCRVNRSDFHLVLVQPLEKSTRSSTRLVDRKLSIYRWQIWAWTRCEVIPLSCIVHGAVLVVDAKHSGDHLVIDMLDEDMFLRVKYKIS